MRSRSRMRRDSRGRRARSPAACVPGWPRRRCSATAFAPSPARPRSCLRAGLCPLHRMVVDGVDGDSPLRADCRPVRRYGAEALGERAQLGDVGRGAALEVLDRRPSDRPRARVGDAALDHPAGDRDDVQELARGRAQAEAGAEQAEQLDRPVGADLDPVADAQVQHHAHLDRGQERHVGAGDPDRRSDQRVSARRRLDHASRPRAAAVRAGGPRAPARTCRPSRRSCAAPAWPGNGRS